MTHQTTRQVMKILYYKGRKSTKGLKEHSISTSSNLDLQHGRASPRIKQVQTKECPLQFKFIH
uniref:Uncharacterized protein n=1 Tax=Arundo donax TaxID=35708 RepID=A0A0A9DIX6_ARUDO